ncbi:hypothetical protein J437_LFUL007553 [Ladona fulva]|uniref:Uncharacterized protein n=1 Tax=Ladona fulva TaxID=123851 RepID=A0A8K0NSA3_LADFU|nr:hypothetical protein J437_LFUL007553 [Ladona fulva]
MSRNHGAIIDQKLAKYGDSGSGMSLVHNTPVDSEEGLCVGISGATGDVRATTGIFKNVQDSMRRRFEACIQTRGRQYQHVL